MVWKPLPPVSLKQAWETHGLETESRVPDLPRTSRVALEKSLPSLSLHVICSLVYAFINYLGSTYSVPSTVSSWGHSSARLLTFYYGTQRRTFQLSKISAVSGRSSGRGRPEDGHAQPRPGGQRELTGTNGL